MGLDLETGGRDRMCQLMLVLWRVGPLCHWEGYPCDQEFTEIGYEKKRVMEGENICEIHIRMMFGIEKSVK